MLWDHLQPDLAAFETRLEAAQTWVDEAYHPDPGVLKDAAASCFHLAWEEAKHISPESRKPKPVGALTMAMRNRRQALKEGRLDGELPSEPFIEQAFVPRGLPELPATGVVGELAQQRKRGRPTEISEELKKKALTVKGDTPRARILYQVKYPTPQQVKNVYSILRHYKRTHQPKQG